jgi:hypothetical protein
MTGHCLSRIHVERIDSWKFFAIDLDVDEVLIHHSSHLLIFETFMRHDMAPMACAVTNAQKHGNIARLRFFEGFIAPWPPIHGVVSMLLQVRGHGITQAIWHISLCQPKPFADLLGRQQTRKVSNKCGDA